MTLHTHGCRLAAGLLLTLAASTPIGGFAQQNDADGADPAWKENDIALPASPKKENLMTFYVSPTATIRFAIDAQSVSVDKDGVIRYTLVATSSAGASNISYEGIRCETAEKKLYAFGQADGSWTRSKRGNWDQITSIGANRQHAALVQDYFCEGHTIAGRAAIIVERLRTNKPLR
jgi:hypothetical protein